MYSREPRDISFSLKNLGTNCNISPASYEFADFNATRNGNSPFGVNKSRECVERAVARDDLAPNSYDWSKAIDSSKKIPFKFSSRNAARVEFAAKQSVPGPGTYNLPCHKPTDSKDTAQLSSAQVLNSQTAAKTLKSRLSRSTPVNNHATVPGSKFNPPSIPSKGQCFGYKESATGGMLPNKPPNSDKSLGPAFYNNEPVVNRVTEKYKGMKFGGRSEKRHVFTPSPDNPSPCQYNLTGTDMSQKIGTAQANNRKMINLNRSSDCQRSVNNCELSQRGDKSTSNLRATDILMKQRLKENLPGPADYFCNSQPRQPDTARRAPFEAAESQNASEKPSRVGVSRKAAVRPPFLSTCARFDWAANADNGGNLALSRLAGDLSKETNEDLSVAKNQDCEWFVFDKAQSPCPWSYEIEKYNAFGKLNASEKNKHNVAFGSCAKRKDESNDYPAKDYTPGPGDYEPQQHSTRIGHTNGCKLDIDDKLNMYDIYGFGSTERRFYEANKKKTTNVAKLDADDDHTPSPNQYFLESSIDKLVIVKQIKKPCPNSSFLSKCDRFVDDTAAGIASTKTPGPGTYNIQSKAPVRDGYKGKWRMQAAAKTDMESLHGPPPQSLKTSNKHTAIGSQTSSAQALPGPGTYNTATYLSIDQKRCKGAVFGRSKRFTSGSLGRSSQPGPANYSLAGQFGNIRTFNKTLK